MLLQRMDDRVSIIRPWFTQYKFHLVQNIEHLKKLVDICVSRKLCALDLECTGLDNRIYPDEYFEDGIKTRHGIRTISRIAGVCISFDGENGYYVPLSHEPEDSQNLPWDPAWDELTRIVQNCRVIFHNSKFDQEYLYPVTGKEYWQFDEYEDTFFLAKTISPLKIHPAGLKPLSKQHFGIEMVELDELFTQERKDQLKREKQGYNYALLHPKEGLEYGCSDGIFTYKLFHLLREKLSPGDERIYNLEKSFCNVLREMERNRVHLDVERVNQLHVECKAAIIEVGETIRKYIEKSTGNTGKFLTLNIGSTKQLSSVLFTDPEGMKLKPTPEMLTAAAEGGYESADDDDDEEDGDSEIQYSLKDEAVKSLHRAYGKTHSVQREGVKDKDGKPKHESIFELILEYRHYDKMNGSYIDKFVNSVDKYGDVRPNFNQIGTDTTRLSSRAGKIEDGYSGVNFQGIPRDSDDDKPELFKQIRTCIAPRTGWMLVKLDYAGEELRVVTNLSGDPIWTKSFLFEDGDVHSITARTLFGKPDVNKDERNRGKRCNFAFIYGGGAGAIQRNIGCSIEDAQRHMGNLRNDVPILMGYVEHQKGFARKNKCIFTAFGRRIPIPTIDSPIRAIRAKAERCAINYTIQATSADVIKYAMCYVDKQLRALGWKDRCRYILTVHDEVVYEIKPEYMMEVIRKLDEWMTLPWKLPKAHGRDWIVPLLTEPGIDIHWRARFDYFKMVDGLPAKPSDINEDGTYKGKLKKDEYFADGRIYQKVPDFLEKYIQRLPPAPKNPELTTGSTGPAEAPKAQEKVAETQEKPMEKPSVKDEPMAAPPEAKPVPELPPKPVSPLSVDIDLDSIILDSVPAAAKPSSIESGLEKLTIGTPQEFDLETSVVSELPKAPKPPANGTNGQKNQDTNILRWTLRSVLNEYTMRRLHAVCILAEGDTPLRVVTLKGEILIGEDVGMKVNPLEFPLLAKVFGLG